MIILYYFVHTLSSDKLKNICLIFLTVRTRPRPHTVSRGQRGSLRGCCKRPSCPALRSAVRQVKRSARTMASPNGNGKTLFFCFRRRSLRNGADCDCQGGKGGDFQRKYYPYLDWLKAERAVSAVKRKERSFRNALFITYGKEKTSSFFPVSVRLERKQSVRIS